MALDRLTGEHSLAFIRSEQLFDYARSNSLWYMAFGIACCAIEGLMSASGPRFDFDRMGVFILLEMVVFVAILVFGLAYAWKAGALTWRSIA